MELLRKLNNTKLNNNLFLFIIILFFSLFINLIIPKYSFAENVYYKNLSDDDFTNMLSLKVDDIVDPWQWITDTQTFVAVEKDTDTGQLQYWWNAPNIQMTANNELSKYIVNKGYGLYFGHDPKDSQWIVPVGGNTKKKTGLQKYGFNIDSPVYTGERPIITISVSDVILPDNPVDAAVGVLKLIFDGELIDAPTDDDLNTLTYISPQDYETTDKSWETWVRKNWYAKAVNIPDGQLLIGGLNDKGLDANGKQWSAYSIFDDAKVKEPNLSAKNICDRLKATCGSKYQEVCKNIILVCDGGKGGMHATQRIMPYNLSTMNSTDQKLFHGVTDPRSDMQTSAYGTGLDKTIPNMFAKIGIVICGKLSEYTIALTSLASFDFFDTTGIDPTFMWVNDIARFLLLLLIGGVLFLCVKAAFRVATNFDNSGSLVIRAIGCFFLACLLAGFAAVPSETYGLIKTISTTAFNIANVGFQTNSTVSSLYGDGDATEKEQCEYWLPYFNVWCVYNTNHSLTDDAQNIDKTPDGKPEKKNLVKPKIGGVQQNLWCTLLADAVTDPNQACSGNPYRMVDHFMAPRISSLTLDNSDNNHKLKDIEVKQNENYNGYIQTSFEFGSIILILLLFVLALMKVLLFYEFMFNIMMLFVNLCMSYDNLNGVKQTFAQLGCSMLNIMGMNMVMGFVVMLSISLTGPASICFSIFTVWILKQVYKLWTNTDTAFRPRSICGAVRLIRKAKHKIKESVGIM